MKLVKWLIGGGIGAAIGGAVWIAVIHFTGYELGWIAWGVGGLAGLGVAITGDADLDGGSGIVAAGLAIAAILLGKVMIYDHYANAMVAQISAQLTSEQAYISTVANRIIGREGYSESELMAMPYPAPTGTTAEALDAIDSLAEIEAIDLDYAANYPIEIWAQAEQEWQGMASADRQTIQDEHQQAVDEMEAYATAGTSLGDVVGIFDALWLFLAAGTAYKLGSQGCGLSLNLGQVRRRPPGWREPMPGLPSCTGCGSGMAENEARCEACGRALTTRVPVGSSD
jgi:hypothetical protein